ncbi:MAG: hypothetical protein AB7O62_00305 [Pirellulales bacterium]
MSNTVRTIPDWALRLVTQVRRTGIGLAVNLANFRFGPLGHVPTAYERRGGRGSPVLRRHRQNNRRLANL